MKHRGRAGKTEAPLAAGRGIILKSPREIELMRAAGRVVHEVLRRVRELVKPGVTTAKLNAVAEELIETAGGTALFRGVTHPQAKFPFPAALCTSVNEELVHGIPSDRPLCDGDIVSVDCGVRLAGYCGDAAITVPVGQVSHEAVHLIKTTEAALRAAIEAIRPGRFWSEIAEEIQAVVERERFSVVRDFVGHGIGRDMHEEPKVPNYWTARNRQMDFELVAGTVLAIEPMVNVGTHAVEYTGDDGWVVATKDRKFAAHVEHTVAVTKLGADVLTDGR